MKLSSVRLLGATSLWLVIVSCTNDLSQFPEDPFLFSGTEGAENLVQVNDIQFNEKATKVWNMQVSGSSLYMTGLPFGFARLETATNPDAPPLTFTLSNQLDRVGPGWIANAFASGSLMISPTQALTSGQAGASLFDLLDTTRPKEVNRFPPYDPASGAPVEDQDFVWAATVADPRMPLVYAFRSQDHSLTYQMNGTDAQLVSKTPYLNNGQNLCCVNSAAVFNNRVYVSFRNRIVILDLDPEGGLINPREFMGLNPAWITATQRFLYVAHEPVPYLNQKGRTRAPGIYIFDSRQQRVGFLATVPRVFAISPNDTHLYAAGSSYGLDEVIRVFRIER